MPNWFCAAPRATGQAWRSARRPRPAPRVFVAVLGRDGAARAPRSGDSFITRMTLPVEHAALAGRRVARAPERRKTGAVCAWRAAGQRRDGDTAACRRNEGQAQHVDYSSSCVGRLVPASAPRVWRQTLCKDLLGRQPAELHHELVSAQGESGPARMLNAQRGDDGKEQPGAHPAQSHARPTSRRAAATACTCGCTTALGDALLRHVHWQHPRPCYASRSRAHSPESPARGARPRFDQLRPSRKTNCAPCYTFQPHHPIASSPDLDRTR